MFGKIFITQLRNCVMLVTPLVTGTVFERKQKREKRHRNIGQYRVIFLGFFCRAGGGGKEGPVSLTAKRGPADDLNVRYAIYY